MLVITLRINPENNSIHIGDLVRVSLLEVRGNAVRLGIEAPKEVSILRDKIWKRDQEDRKKQIQPVLRFLCYSCGENPCLC